MWGHDFRPDYLFIRRALEELGEPAVLGMTATATPANAAAIADALGGALEVVRTSVVRPNLRYDVERGRERGGAAPRACSPAAQTSTDGVAIVYARSRRSCEEIARTLRGHGIRAGALPRGARAGGAHARPGGLRRRPHARSSSRRPRSAWASTSATSGSSRSSTSPTRSRATCRWSAAPAATARRATPCCFAGDADATAAAAVRARRRPGAGRSCGASTARSATRAGRSRPDALDEAVDGDHDPRVLVGMLEQAGIVRRGYDAGRAMRIELLPVGPARARPSTTLLERYAREAAARVERIVEFAESERCRHLQVAEHFGETLDGAVRRVRRLRAAATAPATAPDRTPARSRTTRPGRSSTPWRASPGRSAGAASSRCSAARSRRRRPPARSPAFGSLGAASEAEVTRWVRALEAAGALVEVESDGFRVLTPRGRASHCPSLRARGRDGRRGRPARRRAPGLALAARHERTACRPTSSSTTRRSASSPRARPGSAAELAVVKGLGPAKIDRYGDELLDVLATA